MITLILVWVNTKTNCEYSFVFALTAIIDITIINRIAGLLS